MGVILNGTADYDMVRQELGGIDEFTLTDAAIAADNLLGVAEADIEMMVEAQAANGVPSVAYIMAGTLPAKARDKTFLRAAVVAYITTMAAVQITSLQTTSITDDGQTIDYGGAGTSYRDTEAAAKRRAGQWLAKITNWKSTPINAPTLTGPTRSGLTPDTLSGFRLC